MVAPSHDLRSHSPPAAYLNPYLSMERDLFQGEPLAFSGRDALVQYLRSSAVVAGVEDFLSRPTWTLEQIAQRSIDITTARAIHTRRYHVGPLRLIRQWAHEYLRQHWRNFVDASSAEGYQAALDAAVASLQSEFATETALTAEELGEEPYALTYGRAAKMIGLMLKHIALCDLLPAVERRDVFRRVHVALDRYTLAAAAQLAPELRLQAEPSMGDVESRDAYLATQRWIAGVCEEAGVPASTYEVGLFNLPRGEWHKKPTLLDLSDIPAGVTVVASRKDGTQARSARQPTPTLFVGRTVTANTDAVSDRPARPSPRPAGRPVRERVAIPRTASWASVIAHRTVTNSLAIEVNADSRATHRGAPITGYIEVVDARDLDVARTGVGERQVRAYLTWFGRSPERGFVEVTLTGACVVHERFSGEVVDNLGDPRSRTLIAE